MLSKLAANNPDCVTVTSLGVSVAPTAITLMVAVRTEELVFAVKLQVIVPVSFPLGPAVPLVPEISSQLMPDVTAAVQGIDPVPVLETLNVAAPASLVTSWLAGDTDRTGCPACVTFTSWGLPIAPTAVTLMVAVRGEWLVFAVKLQLTVPALVPRAPDVIESQSLPDVTAAVQGIVPVPVLKMPNVAVPVFFATSRLTGDTDRTGCELPLPACVTVTSFGLPIAPVAVTRIVAVRDEAPALAVKLQLTVPASVPLEPDMISQSLPDVTAAVQGIVPVPVLEMLNVVVPTPFATSRLTGDTDRTGCVLPLPACVTVTSIGLLVAPVAVTRIVAVRDEAPALAVKLQLTVPASVPLEPDMISQSLPDVTAAVQGIVPVPVLEMLNVVVPTPFATSRLTGDTDRTGCVLPLPACVTVTSIGLLVAPVAVTRIVAVRDEAPALAVKLQLTVPALVPLEPDMIESQSLIGVTAAVQGIVPVPVFETLNVVVPAVLATL